LLGKSLMRPKFPLPPPRAGAAAVAASQVPADAQQDVATMHWDPAPAESGSAESGPKEIATSATTTATLRRYADGIFVTAEGVDVAAATNAVSLPYAKSDVRFRVGSYDILGELGRGGMGVVYKAYSLKLCRFVAVKMMTSGRFASEAETIRFQNEAMLAARLEHPNIVPVYDTGEHEGHLYFVMAFVPGRGLGSLIKDELEAKDANTREAILEAGVRALAKCARALEYAHQRGIVHRDIKPDNIIIDAEGEPHITDFGIAKNVQREVSLTKPGAIVGTPQYMAPEQVNSLTERIGPAADVYSLGATLYDLATGCRPFEHDNPIAILLAVLHSLPEPARAQAKKTLGRTLSPDLDLIIQKAMEKRAADRYANAAAMASDLEAYLEDRPVAARPIGAIERTKKLIRRNRAAFAMVVIAALTLITLAVGFGTVLAFNLSATSDSLRVQDTQAGHDQTATLERAITANMIEGRADVVRNLIQKLRESPDVSMMEVVRTDRTLAYSDAGTRNAVAKRIADPALRSAAIAKIPGFDTSLEMVESIAFKRIDAAPKTEGTSFQIDDATWKEVLNTRQPVARVEDINGVPHLTVLRPIPNGPTCQICHGAIADGTNAAANPYANMYGSFMNDPENRTRAVLVVRRSQAAVEAQIADNTRDTLLVGGGTTLGLLVLLFVVSRLFGIRLRPQRFV